MLIVLSGLPGTSKSIIANGVGRARRLPVLSVDPIESAILRSRAKPTFETGLAAYLVAETIADACLELGLDPVIDAVNSIDPARDMWRRLATQRDVELRIIECVLADEGTHRARLATRNRGLKLGEPSWADVERRRTEWTPWPEPHLTIDAMQPVDANVMRVLAYLDTP